MRPLLLVGLILALPVAAGAALFVTLPAPVDQAIACGAEACFALQPGDAAVRIEGGSSYAFLRADGAALAVGSLCAPALLDVPEGAAMLRVDPAAC